MKIILGRIFPANPEAKRIGDAEDKTRQNGEVNNHENVKIDVMRDFLNPKHEYRNPKQYLKLNIPSSRIKCNT
jgi:hypothetical protein